MRRGNSFILQIKDDGRGIDPAKIASIAQSKGLPLTDTSTPQKLLAVICQPGFTSAKAVTDVSGRGVGMDVVASQVAAMGGHIELDTTVGKGTTFTIQIPVPQMLVRCMLLQAGDFQFAVPTAEIFTTLLLGDLLWETVRDKPYGLVIEEDTGKMPAIDLYQYWQGDMTPALPAHQHCGTLQTARSHRRSVVDRRRSGRTKRSCSQFHPLPSHPAHWLSGSEFDAQWQADPCD